MPMEKYISPFTDYGFKKLFGEEDSKSYLLEFINAFLPAHHRINGIQFNKNEYMPETEKRRTAIIDLTCTTEKGETIIIELQREAQTYFVDRSIYYSSCVISQQAQRGNDWHYKLQPVYMISILNFNFSHLQNNDLCTTVQLKTHNNEVFYNKLVYVYLNVKSFAKTEHDLQTEQDKWFFIFKNMANLDHIPESLQTPAFNDLFKKAEVAKMNAEQYAIYSQDLKQIWDENSILDTKLKEGEMKGKLVVAKNLRLMNMSIEQIMQVTGLSQQDIENL